MSARVLMTSSGAFMIAIGAVLNFAPHEAAVRLGMDAGVAATLALQLLAGFAMGLGVVNWMWRGNAIGGIHGKAIGMGNLLQFAVGAFGLAKAASADSPPVLLALLAVYGVFAAWFAYVVFLGKGAPQGAAC